MAARCSCSGFYFPHKMHVPRICAVFASCIYLQSVAGQCTRCEREIRQENTTERSENESPLERCETQSSPSWLDIGMLDAERVASVLVAWMQNAWNREVKVKLRILGNEQNDTLMSVQFRDTNPTTENNSESTKIVGRTFGIRRRMQLFFMLPISFKLGIIMTLLLVLTAVSLKTLFVGFVILLLLLHHTQGHAKLSSPYKTHQVADSHKNIHIHIHTSPEDHRPYAQSWNEPSQPLIYSA